MHGLWTLRFWTLDFCHITWYDLSHLFVEFAFSRQLMMSELLIRFCLSWNRVEEMLATSSQRLVSFSSALFNIRFQSDLPYNLYLVTQYTNLSEDVSASIPEVSPSAISLPRLARLSRNPMCKMQHVSFPPATSKFLVNPNWSGLCQFYFRSWSLY